MCEVKQAILKLFKCEVGSSKGDPWKVGRGMSGASGRAKPGGKTKGVWIANARGVGAAMIGRIGIVSTMPGELVTDDGDDTCGVFGVWGGKGLLGLEWSCFVFSFSLLWYLLVRSLSLRWSCQCFMFCIYPLLNWVRVVEPRQSQGPTGRATVWKISERARQRGQNPDNPPGYPTRTKVLLSPDNLNGEGSNRMWMC